MKKIISYALYGDAKKYWYGMLCNVEQAKIIYPDWICRVYYDLTVPSTVIDELKTYDNVELVNMDGITEYFKMSWRFFAIDDDDVEIMICRDADSRLSWREKKCVDIFIESDKLLHSIRDNRNHPDIMGGMWGLKKNDRIKVREELNGFGFPPPDPDQIFLRSKLVPKFLDSYMIHCSTYLNTFPVEQTNERFVGEWWCENNQGMPKNHIWF